MRLLPSSSGQWLNSRSPPDASTRVQVAAPGPDLAREPKVATLPPIHSTRTRNAEKRFTTLLILIALFVGFSPAGFSQPEVQPEADEVLKAAHAYLSGLNSLAIKAVTTEETVFEDTHKLQFGGTLELGIRRPSQLFAVVHED